MTRILVVDDHPVVRRGIRNILEDGIAGVEVGEASTGEEALSAFRGGTWDVVVLDLGLPDRPGIEVLRQMRGERAETPVLILTMHDEASYAVRLLRAGASGYLTKEGAPSELVAAVSKVARGGRYISPSLAEQLAAHLGGGDRPPHEALSDREFQVFGQMAAGKSLTEIARMLFVSVKTVSTHRARILQKLGIRNNAELVQYALRHGLIP